MLEILHFLDLKMYQNCQKINLAKKIFRGRIDVRNFTIFCFKNALKLRKNRHCEKNFPRPLNLLAPHRGNKRKKDTLR